jgi:hypothetical protein
VDEGMTVLLPALQARRLERNERAWSQFVRLCLDHPLRQLLHQDPFTHRAFSKPRGYAGDAALLDFIYGEEEGWPAPAASEMGQSIYASTTCSSACEAVRARRAFIADMIDRLTEEVPHPHLLSIAAGHLREAELCAAVKRRKLGRYVALDSDQESLAEVQRAYGRFGVESVTASVRQLLTGILDVGYMESFMDWKLLYRDRGAMIQLADDIPQEQIREIRIVAEENQNIIFLLVTKADETNILNRSHKELNRPHFALQRRRGKGQS